MSADERELVLDTETTGFLADKDDRIVEVGIVEVVNRARTGRVLHLYIDPERDVPEEAYAIHGLSRDDLVNQHKAKIFKFHAQEILDFVGDDTIIAHNAGFDMKFLNMELARAGFQTFEERGNKVIDSLRIAGVKFPGQANSLDALCRRLLGKDNYSRDLHGALLDASLLADVYNLMTVEQNNLQLDDRLKLPTSTINPQRLELTPGALKRPKLSAEDAERHARFCEKIAKASGGACLASSLGM